MSQDGTTGAPWRRPGRKVTGGGSDGRRREPQRRAGRCADHPEMLADLQAGLLDDATGRRLRRRARTDPDAARQLAALDRVRRELAESAPTRPRPPTCPPR